MKVFIKIDALVGQDFAFKRWPFPSVRGAQLSPRLMFDAEPICKDETRRFKLTAPGFGQLGAKGDYGNGAIYANREDIEDAITEELLTALASNG